MKFNSILIVLPILTVLMFDLGLSLRVSDFINIFKKPKAMIAGLTGQLMALPLIALAVGTLCGLQPEFFIGLMLIACCPMWLLSARGDVPSGCLPLPVTSGITDAALSIIHYCYLNDSCYLYTATG